MKAVKRILALAAVMIIGLANAFALSEDNTVVEKLGNLSRSEFEETMNDTTEDEWIEVIGESMGEESSITSFYQVTDENLDEEDEEMLDFVEKNLKKNYGVTKNDAFISMVIRDINIAKSSLDGWMVLTHYDGKKYLHYPFYFALSL